MALLPYTERSSRLCFAPFAFYRSLREFDSAPCQSSFAVRQRTPSDQISEDKFLKVVLVDFLVGDHFRIDLDQQSSFLVVVRINSTIIATPFTKKGFSKTSSSECSAPSRKDLSPTHPAAGSTIIVDAGKVKNMTFVCDAVPSTVVDYWLPMRPKPTTMFRGENVSDCRKKIFGYVEFKLA